MNQAACKLFVIRFDKKNDSNLFGKLNKLNLDSIILSSRTQT